MVKYDNKPRCNKVVGQRGEILLPQIKLQQSLARRLASRPDTPRDDEPLELVIVQMHCSIELAS